MKILANLFLFLSFLSTIYGQNKDTRAKLNIEGIVYEISVSPNENLWLTTGDGRTYFSENIDSNWHYGKPLFKEDKELDYFGLNYPWLDRITFFNKDTAIMSGYISVKRGDFYHNGIYYTKNAGKTWKMINYRGNDMINSVSVEKNGNAWMVGSSGAIYYSDNYGRKWVKLNSPFNAESKIQCIFMVSENEGIAGSFVNTLYSTIDNWKSYTQIETPLSQNKYQLDNDIAYNQRIEKIFIWLDKYYVINQSNHFFYSEKSKIKWKEFPISIIDIEIDRDSKKMYAITKEFKTISFSNPFEYAYVSDKRISTHPQNIKVINGSVYILDET
jgi:hypothetical protein